MRSYESIFETRYSRVEYVEREGRIFVALEAPRPHRHGFFRPLISGLLRALTHRPAGWTAAR